MCHFLTIAVPGGAVPDVPEEFRRKMNFAAHRNRPVTGHELSDWASFTATSGGYSCGLYRATDDSPEDRAKLVKKYRKQGWSNTRIRRALESHRTGPTRSAGLRGDILGLVTGLTNEFGTIQLSVHWYSGQLETENFVLNNVGCVSLEDFKCDTSTLCDETTIMIKAGTAVH